MESKSGWSPVSWKGKPIQQQPNYKDAKEAEAVFAKIRQLPPLVHHSEVDRLKQQLAEAQEGKRFVLQGGDCAERFADCAQSTIEAKLKIILQMSLILVWGARIPTVRIGRIAGQYGKPRSSPTEVVDGKEMPSYKGDNINSFEANEEARQHQPSRLVEAHFHSAATLNYIRALIKGGYADLHHAKHWDLGYFADLGLRTKYQKLTERILDALHFMDTCGVNELQHLGTIDLFTSHEGLVLEYEAAVSRVGGLPAPETFYNTGAHFLWIGDRTRQLDGAHVEYFRGIANPVGIKVGPTTDPTELVQLIKTLNPDNEPGKITLISRLGAGRVAELLPPVVQAVQAANVRVLWVCDPMHGNTHKTKDGVKTRSFDAVLQELTATFQQHAALGSRLGGVHFELTGENVTECVGGPQQLVDRDLHLNYTTHCDPRLNYAQSMEVAFRLAELLQEARGVGQRFPAPSPPAQD